MTGPRSYSISVRSDAAFRLPLENEISAHPQGGRDSVPLLIPIAQTSPGGVN